MLEQPALPPPAQAHAQAHAHELAQAQELCAHELCELCELELLELGPDRELEELGLDAGLGAGTCITLTRMYVLGDPEYL